MQHERELRSDIDHMMDVLRANPQTRFTITKLQALTGLPQSFLKKWIDVLEEQGQIRFFYNISDDQFSWIGKDTAPEQTKIEVHEQEPQKSIFRTYSRDEITILLEDVKDTISSAKSINSRIELLKKSKSSDLAALGIAKHNLEEKKKKISHLLSEAKRLKN